MRTGIAVLAEKMERRGQSVKYFKQKSVGCAGGLGVKSQSGEGSGLAARFLA